MKHGGQQGYLRLYLTETKHIKSKKRPVDGWIRTYRRALGMPRDILAKKAGIAPTTATHAENRELSKSITLKKLEQLANALDCDLFYSFIPRNGWPEEVLTEKARKLAERDLKGKNIPKEKYDQELHNLISIYLDKKISEIWKEEEQKLFGKKS